MSTKISFAARLLDWFDRHGRHDLPWQEPRTPYRVWVSEIMLQQTQVSAVVPYFERFMARFPDISALASASQDDVLAHWSGLGYYARARNLHAAARQILNNHGGVFPAEFDFVVNLPGIGRSTAGAILAQSLGQRHPILDGNVKRVLARYFAVAGWPGNKAIADRLWELAEQLTPHSRLADYTQAIMDLGATLCTRGRPRCESCPVNSDCLAYRNDDVSSYPTPKPAKNIPVRQTTMVILRRKQNEIFLIKRPPTGIWGGMWCFPEVPAEDDISNWCKSELGVAAKITDRLPQFRHTFSHFHLDIQPVVATSAKAAGAVRDDDQQRWTDIAEARRLGIAAPIRKLLEQL